jgi:hypothetical protein
MRKPMLFSPKLYFFSALLVAAPVIAQAPTPPPEFWDYLSEYGDENGELLDPLEYDQILSMKEMDEINSKDVPRVNETQDMPVVRNADMKFEQKSSAQASSSAVKGAAL